MFSSSKNSQCKKCWKFGHISTRCPSTLPVCPFCLLAPTKAEHRCPNPSCPKCGNLRPVFACCTSLVACCPNCQEEHAARSKDCPSRPKATPDVPEVRSRQTQESIDLAEAQAGPATVLRPTPSGTPRTPSASVLPYDAPPPRQRAQRTITVTDLAPRESGDESLDSNSSLSSARQWRIFSPITPTAVLSSRPFQLFNITALGAGMFFSHFFTVLQCCLTLLYLLLFKTPPPGVWFCRHSRDLCPSPPPPGRPRVAIYFSRTLNQHLSCSPVFYDSSEMLSVDVFSPEGLFGSPHRSHRVTSVYLLRTHRPPYRSIPPARIFSFLSYPDLVLGDFNLHHPLADPCHSLSEREFIRSTRYVDAAFDVPFHVLNTPGVYTWFPFDTISRPSVLDLAFAHTDVSPLVSLWDTPPPLHWLRPRSMCDNT